jgi:hypothetical protein
VAIPWPGGGAPCIGYPGSQPSARRTAVRPSRLLVDPDPPGRRR